MHDTEVGNRNVVTGHHVGSAALRQHAALVEHDDPVGQLGDDAHDVLDEHDRRALVANAANQLDGAVDLGWRQSGQHFVEQQPGCAASARELELGLMQVKLAR
jgi:hypothetical protein